MKKIAVAPFRLCVVLALCATLQALVWTGEAIGDGNASVHSRDNRWINGLDGSVPGQRSVKLQGGHLQNGRWKVLLYAAGTGTGDKDPLCLAGVIVRDRLSGGSSVLQGPASCEARGDTDGNRISTALQVGRPPIEILAFVFGKRVWRVELMRASGRAVAFKTRRLTSADRSKLAVNHVNFLVARTPASDCFTAIRSWDRHGHVVGGSRLAGC